MLLFNTKAYDASISGMTTADYVHLSRWPLLAFGSRDAARVVSEQSSTAGSFSLLAELGAALILEGSRS